MWDEPSDPTMPPTRRSTGGQAREVWSLAVVLGAAARRDA